MRFGEFFQAVCDQLAKQHNWSDPKQVVSDQTSLDTIHGQYGLAMDAALGDDPDWKAYVGQTAYKINSDINNAAGKAVSETIVEGWI